MKKRNIITDIGVLIPEEYVLSEARINKANAALKQKAAFSTPAMKQMHSITVRNAMASKVLRQHLSDTARKVGKDPQVKANRSAAQRKIMTPERSKKMSEIRKVSHNTPEFLAKNSAAQKIAQNDPVLRQAHREKISRPCTIDGINIYGGVRLLMDALGQGKSGAKHPNFRYLPKGTKATV